MSNNFPSVPGASDLQLYSIEYTFIPPTPALPPIPGTTVNLINGFADLTGNATTVQVIFDTPGEAGSFDQQAFEGLVTQAITGVCQLWAALEGTTLADEQAKITSIQRQWRWTDAAGNYCIYTDTMPYSPAG